MKPDEFAFVNQQLSSMLKEGIPLEGALRQLCATMRRGDLRAELEALAADLEKGRPLPESLTHRRLPAFYVQMLRVGYASNDLPGVLLLVADYYQRLNAIWLRLKGLMVYPAIVLLASLAISVLVTIGFHWFLYEVMADMLGDDEFPAITIIGLWGPLFTLLLISGLCVCFVAVPGTRRSLRWRLPAFQDASLAQFAAAMAAMLKGGCTLGDAIGLMHSLEAGTPAGKELVRWHSRLAGGHGTLGEIVSGSRLFPATFLWLITNAREDPAAGFARAAQVYQTRAANRVDMLLYAALPVSVLCLGALLLFQFSAAMQPLISLLNNLGAS